MFEDETSESEYQKASLEKKAEILEGLKSDVLETTKAEFFEWLRKSGVKSTRKEK